MQHFPVKVGTWAAMVILMAAATAFVGCAPTYTDYAAFIRHPTPVVGGKPYVIEPPDSIRIIAPAAPEINNVEQTLRPDGYITLYLLGDVFAAGKTPTQLANEIQDKIKEYYTDVHVQVQVTGYNSKVYYMAGETAAGPKPYTGRVTVLDAVLRAGIPPTAWPEKCVVMRPNENGQLIKRMTVNLKEMITKGDLKHNAVLEEGDIVYIPTNPLASIGRIVQNLISPVNPLLTAAATPARATTAVSTGGVVSGY